MSIQNTAGIISECARKAELKGARVQRKRIKAHIMDWNLDAFEAECESKHWDRQTAVGVYSSRLIDFINESPRRYNARKGGLQAKKAVKK